MNKEEKELVEGIKQYPTHRELCLIHVIERLDEELDKKDKVIDLISELLCGIDVMNELGKESWNWNKEQMKEYFYKKAEEENEEI